MCIFGSAQDCAITTHTGEISARGYWITNMPFDHIEDAMNEMRDEIMRLMELHLEVMSYFTRAAEAAAKAQNEHEAKPIAKTVR